MDYGFDVVSVWTHATANDIEELLQHVLGGHFVSEHCGFRYLYLRHQHAEVAVRFADNMIEETDPNIFVFIDPVDNTSSLSQQRVAAMTVFEALAKVIPDRLELRAEDDSTIRCRPALR